MPESTLDAEYPRTASAACVASAGAGVLAAWLAAGSMGVLAEPLRVALAYPALLVAAVLSWPSQRWQRWLLVGLLVVAVLPIAFSAGPLDELLVVAAAIALLAAFADGVRQTALQVTAQAIVVLAVFRFACSSIAVVWLAADAVGGLLGGFAGWLSGRPLSIGSTYAGLDFLVLTGALFAGWIGATGKPRLSTVREITVRFFRGVSFQLAGDNGIASWKLTPLVSRTVLGRAVFAGAAILVAHLVYLLVMARALDLSALLPTPPQPTSDHPYVPPDWHWAGETAPLIPWNLPALGALLHLVVVCGMLRWAAWVARTRVAGDDPTRTPSPRGWRLASDAGPLVLAVLLPVSATLFLTRSDLSNRKIVANQGGHLDWGRPQHDRYGQQSAGMFGMLPLLVESLGGRLTTSAELNERDLADADVLMLIHPIGSLPAATRQRILEYVRRGGSLLVLAEPYFQDGSVRSAFNDILSASAMRVRNDVAISVTGGWQQALETLAHPVSCGEDVRLGFLFTDAGSSLRIGWPARPLVVGRWGWSDPGNDAVQTGVYRFEAGERLGDLVLAAEQRFGRGTMVVLGNSYSLSNEGVVRGYALAGRLLTYLAHKRGSPQSLWRQAITLVLCLGLLVLIGRNPAPERLAAAAVLLAISLAVCEGASRTVTSVVPDGRLNDESVAREPRAPRGTANNLAYIDASHVEAYGDENWVFEGINGLALTLMRSGYLAATLPEMTRERLERAAIVVSIAPARRFSPAERELVREFVKGGGIFICTVGAEEASASESLLAAFGLRVPVSPVPTVGSWREPEPVGHLRSLYLNAKDYGAGDYKAGVTFHAGWPIEVDASDAEVLVRGPREEPLVVSRPVGRGRVVVIGDTGFALNKNLEYIGGEPFEEGGYENAHFWRWLISRITERPEWIPPPPPPKPAAGAGQEEQP